MNRGKKKDLRKQNDTNSEFEHSSKPVSYSGIDLTDEIKTPTFLAIFVTDSAHKILCVFVTSNVPENTVKFSRNR